MNLFLLYCALCFVNVVLQTLRSVCTIKCSSFVAACMNAVAYGLYVFVIFYTNADGLSLWGKAAITAAANLLGGKYLADCTLYVTVEPCVMCAGAIGWAQIGRVVYGTPDEKRGFQRYAPEALHPRCTVTQGVLETECRELMQAFFAAKRK